MDIPARYRRAVTSHRRITSRIARINRKSVDPLRPRSPPGCSPEILSSAIDRANAMDDPIESRMPERRS